MKPVSFTSTPLIHSSGNTHARSDNSAFSGRLESSLVESHQDQLSIRFGNDAKNLVDAANQALRKSMNQLETLSSGQSSTTLLDILESLDEALRQGADPNIGVQMVQSGQYEFTPLMKAAQYGQVPVLKRLLEAGANPNSETQTLHYTALMLAAMEPEKQTPLTDYLACVRLLLDASADPMVEAGRINVFGEKASLGNALSLAKEFHASPAIIALLEERSRPHAAPAKA